MNVIQLLPRDPSSCDNGSGPQSSCRYRSCPLYKAPPCFSRRLEELLSNRTCYGTSYPDWRQFTRYFNINIPVGEQGVVRYWVHGHQNKDQHTIQCVLEFAEEKGHSPLVYEFEKLIEGKLYTQQYGCNCELLFFNIIQFISKKFLVMYVHQI